MNKKLLLITTIIVVLIGSGFIYLMTQDKSESNQTPSTSQAVPPTEESKNEKENVTAGRYVDYDENTLATTEGTKLLFFYAPWCPQCRALEASINESTIPAGVTIFKVDYDTNQKLRQKYGVTIQTTLVKVDDSGNLVEKYVAYDEPNFEAVKENLL